MGIYCDYNDLLKI